MPGLRRHAAPIDAVDTVSILSDTECVARKKIVPDDPYLEGHYPHVTIFPGVFIIESMHQTVRELVRRTVGPDAVAQLTEITSVRFMAPLLPGDTLDLTCTTRPSAPGFLAIKAVGRNGDVKAAQITATFKIDNAGEGKTDA
jgi:3-hydroxyacyl-[acyl-carrier-protein] dehydratase